MYGKSESLTYCFFNELHQSRTRFDYQKQDVAFNSKRIIKEIYVLVDLFYNVKSYRKSSGIQISSSFSVNSSYFEFVESASADSHLQT